MSGVARKSRAILLAARIKHLLRSKAGFKLLCHSPLLLWSLGVLLIVSAYVPGIHGPLVFDDQLNIVENPDVAIRDLSPASLKTALLSNHSGPLKRVLPALSFGINHYFAGGFAETWVFKGTNIFIHCLNSALVFWLLCRLWPRLFRDGQPSAQDVYAGAFVALVWALHPLQLTSVLYVVQRMTSLSAFFVLLGLGLFVHGRMILEEGRGAGLAWMAGGLVGGTALGLACKENAALLPLYAGVIEWTSFDRASLEPRLRRHLTVFFGVFVVLPIILGLVYCFFYPGMILSGYQRRPFTLEERLLTEGRVLWLYLDLLAVPDITQMGLFHDDFSISRGLLSPWTTLAATAAWGAVFSLALSWRHRWPAVTFAVLWFLMGHAVESTVIPLQLVHEHRNYLASLGPVIGFGHGVFALIRGARACWLRPALALLILSGLYFATAVRAHWWRSETSFITTEARNHPDSPNTQYLMGELLAKKLQRHDLAYNFYWRAAKLEPEEAGYRISLGMMTPPDAAAKLQPWEKPILVDSAHVAELLRRKPVSAWAMRALDVAYRCVAKFYPSCRPHVHDVRQWLQAATENPLIRGVNRRHFLLSKYSIEMKYRLYVEAQRSLKRAMSLEPGYDSYPLMEVDVLGVLGRFDEASLKLEELERRYPQGETRYRPQIDRMRKALETKMAERANGRRVDLQGNSVVDAEPRTQQSRGAETMTAKRVGVPAI